MSRTKTAGFPQPPDVVRALEAADAAKLGELAVEPGRVSNLAGLYN